MSQLVQLRRGLAATWTSVNPTLAAGELGVETDTLKVKVGNGSTAWASLAYIVGSGGGGIADAANDAFYYLRHALGWSAASPFASLTKTAVKTANYTTAGNEIIPADTSSAGWNLQLPTAPPDGTLVWPTNHKAGAGTGWSVNPLILLRGGSDTIDQVAANAALTGGRGTLLQYVTATTDWRVLLSDAGPVGIGALLAANNLSDVASLGTAQTNLGFSTFFKTLLSAASALLFRVAINKGAAALTDGANIATDCSTGNFFTVTLGGNRTLTNPTNLAAGASYVWAIKQDATGSRTLAYGATFDFGAAGAPTLTTTANKTDYLTGYSPDGTKLHVTFVGGYS